jgi:HEAT repeat protein
VRRADLALGVLVLAGCGARDEVPPGPPPAFNKIPPTLPRLFRQRSLAQWLDLAGSPDAARRAEAPWALAELTTDAKVVAPVLERLLGDPSPDVRYAAAVAVGRFPGDLGPAVTERVAALLGASERGLAHAARTALGALGQRAVPALVSRLAEDDERALTALRVLADLGPAAGGASTALVTALRRDALRPAAAHALERVGAPAVPAMAARLADAGDDEALVLLGLLAARRSEARDHVASLVSAFRRPPPVRSAAGEALLAIGPSGTSALATLARDPDASVAASAAELLARERAR